MIELDQIREQLKIDDEDVSDPILQRLLGAALRWIENRTNRKLYPGDVELPADAPANALLMDDGIELAALLLIGHWASNPSDTSEAKLESIPNGAASLVAPYRWFYDC
ncbi:MULTISPECIES: head-tail connector protein [Cupriavidus]|mgnify:CR=1 FL=1|jgi:Phage gp6-like head-tail connector protein|uniref:head-tail connector protein n=1 Tax=Cupriavidus TaxID=106589 RepID=UPI00057976D3|nr:MULTISPECIES: head-tail connector protein [Cupriavidus]KWR80345.1 hypothetical protein RN01_19125 [Cupriavidus sp. SHE]QWC87709.1 head-tail connector protein [Cupriavidus metallidurans]